MKAGLLSLFYLSTILVGAPALPSLRSSSAQWEIAHIAYDEDNGQFLGFKRDGSVRTIPCPRAACLEAVSRPVRQPNCRRSPVSCIHFVLWWMIVVLTACSIVPGWDALEAYAKSNRGSGSWNIVTNPKEYPGSPTYVCDDPVKIELDGILVKIRENVDKFLIDIIQVILNVKTVQSIMYLGRLEPMAVSLQVQQGSNMSSEYTVTSVSTLAISSTLGVSFGIPLLSADASVTVSKEVTNEQSSSFEMSYSTVVTVTRTIDTKDGKTCPVHLKLHTCTAKSKGQIRYLATGWVWFNYNDRTHGH
ncbi:uncharacterized protein ARMOST_07411 [Armillaria ostoyae]|uniref:Uncharacterized protein n=1 Tax=Armillaria ostoyae TaxID=47428 RepID=A0A284R5R0_ARMOS|nr:uncharacterized protein ARMOST_07411 [Armillaria ostoyae]